MNLRNTYDFVIVGSGPTALAFLKGLENSNSVALIDIGEEPLKKTLELKKDFQELDKLNRSLEKIFSNSGSNVRKSYFGDYFSYSENYKNANVAVGKAGFSKVWGATLASLPKYDLEKIKRKEGVDLTPLYSKVINLFTVFSSDIKKLNFQDSSYKRFRTNTFRNASGLSNLLTSGSNKSKLKFFHAQIAMQIGITEKNCTRCGICQVGCPWDLIWDSENQISECINNKNVKYIRGKVTNIKNSSDFEIVEFENSGVYNYIKGKKIIVCTGALGDALIMKMLMPNYQYRIQDSQTYIYGAFSWRKITDSSVSKDSFAEVFALKTRADGQPEYQSQLYSDSEYLYSRMLHEYAFLKWMPKVLRDFIRSHIVSGLLYFPSDKSGSLLLEHKDSDFRSKNLSTFHKILRYRFIFDFYINLASAGILPLPLTTRNLSIGGGNHFGAIKFRNNEKEGWDSLNLDGKFLNREIYFPGTSSLPFISPGPITLTAMANAFRIANKLSH